MSITSRAHASRGASVLAALVLAAIMASVALLVQQGSPIAINQSQTAGSGAITQSDQKAPGSDKAATDSSTNCVAGYNYEVNTKGATQCVHVRDCHTDAPQTSSKSSSGSSSSGACASGGGSVQPYDEGVCKQWKCQTSFCSPAFGDGKEATCEDVAGGSSAREGVQPGQQISSSDAMKNAASDLAGSVRSGDADGATVKNALAQDPAFQDAFNKAYKDNVDDIFAKADQASQASNDAQSQLEALGCANSSMAGQSQCVEAQKKYDSAQQNLQNLTDQYEKLQDAGSSLSPVSAGAVDACMNSDSNAGDACPGLIQSYCEKNPSDQARCGSSAVTGKSCPAGTYGTPPNCQRQGANTFGGTGNNGSGGRSQNGGNPMGGSQQPQQQRPNSSGSGQQQQQQCQPQYQCTTNGSISTATGAMPVSVVMYNQCPQQGAQWQTYQQCPQGYTCQNNGCVATAPYGYCSDGRTPRTGPAQAQPSASSCTVGTWTDASNGCQTNWQCTSGTSGGMTAQLSCQPTTATAGTTITFSYACAGGATRAAGTNFTISPATSLSGATTTVLQKPTDSATSVTYTLTCTNTNANANPTASATCQVQVGKSSIVLVATPQKISKSETDDLKRKSTIGWVTSGMQSCLISNQDFPEWTQQQTSNTSVGGAVVSPIITADTTFKLTCQTLGGAEASSTVKVLSI